MKRPNKRQNKSLHHDCLQLRSFLTALPAAGEFGRWAAALNFYLSQHVFSGSSKATIHPYLIQ
jgi:hypothetical protein